MTGQTPIPSPEAATVATPTPAPQPVSQAHKAADAAARYYRLICMVPMTGSGKRGDPIRPEFVPTETDGTRSGILAWSVQLTDDKKMAIVHLAASNRHAFDAILADKRPEVRVFEIGKHGKDEIEKELKKYKKDFDLASFRVVAQ